MRVLVTWASRHGATRGVAERIGEVLRERGVDAVVRPVREAGRRDELAAYDAFVVGGAVYAFHWLGDATRFVRRNRALLAERPVWLFGSGPLGRDRVDAAGQDALTVARAREFATFEAEIRPRDARMFFGAYTAGQRPIGLLEHLTRLMPAARDAFPVGDFRDWPEIEAWAAGIAAALGAHPATSAATPAGSGRAVDEARA